MVVLRQAVGVVRREAEGRDVQFEPPQLLLESLIQLVVRPAAFVQTRMVCVDRDGRLSGSACRLSADNLGGPMSTVV